MGSIRVRGAFVVLFGAVVLLSALLLAARPAAGRGGDEAELGAELRPADPKAAVTPGDPVELTGEVFELSGGARDLTRTPVPATFSLRTVDAAGDEIGTFGPFTAGPGGRTTATLPAAATAGVDPGASTGYREVVGVQLVDATSADATTAEGGTAGAVAVGAAPTGPVLENSFVSSVGWVKPGEKYPFTLRVLNYGVTPIAGTTVTLTAPNSTTLTTPTAPAARRASAATH